MKLGVYAIRDNLTGFLSPTVEQNDASAIRNFEHAMANFNSLMYSHPKDYDLYRIGSFDTETGELKKELPAMIAAGSTMRKE